MACRPQLVFLKLVFLDSDVPHVGLPPRWCSSIFAVPHVVFVVWCSVLRRIGNPASTPKPTSQPLNFPTSQPLQRDRTYMQCCAAHPQQDGSQTIFFEIPLPNVNL